MVGFYKASIDYLYERMIDGARKHKVIRSPAVVRSTHEQIRSLSGRDHLPFFLRDIIEEEGSSKKLV